MEIEVAFRGSQGVEALADGQSIPTDRTRGRGVEGTTPSPFDLFVASIARRAGQEVLAFCQARELSMDGLAMRAVVQADRKSKLPSRIRIEIDLPPAFPAGYRAAIVRAAESSTLTRTLGKQPKIEVVAIGPLPDAAVCALH
jgi:putative redox protein